MKNNDILFLDCKFNTEQKGDTETVENISCLQFAVSTQRDFKYMWSPVFAIILLAQLPFLV